MWCIYMLSVEMVPGIGTTFLGALGVIEEMKSPCGGRGLAG